MNKEPTCMKCGSKDLEMGTLPEGFRPKQIKFLSLLGSVRITAQACLDCGFLELNVDPQEVKLAIGK
jgi:predicted nucleic-acid-binding Zn-ribbon protein